MGLKSITNKAINKEKNKIEYKQEHKRRWIEENKAV